MSCLSECLWQSRYEALEHNWVKAADFQSAESEDEDDDDVDHSVDRSDRSDSSDLVIDELDDEGGPPPGCMSKSAPGPAC